MSQDMTREAAEEILELPRRYSREDVRRAHKRLARRYHPDAAKRHDGDEALAQEHMVALNRAREVLLREFAHDPTRLVERISPGITGGFAGVDWRDGAEEDGAAGSDPWDFADAWTEGADRTGHETPRGLRAFLLGPVLLRIVFVALFGWLWWRTFPFLPGNADAASFWTSDLKKQALLVMRAVYPSYLFVYELFSGHVSEFVREVLNGIVSFCTRRYMDLRPKSASYGCALYKILSHQAYSLLLAPLVLWALAACLSATGPVERVLFGLLAAFLGVDCLASFVRGGFVNAWTSALAGWVERRYLLLRSRLLIRCGAWEGAHEQDA